MIIIENYQKVTLTSFVRFKVRDLGFGLGLIYDSLAFGNYHNPKQAYIIPIPSTDLYLH